MSEPSVLTAQQQHLSELMVRSTAIISSEVRAATNVACQSDLGLVLKFERLPVRALIVAVDSLPALV